MEPLYGYGAGKVRRFHTVPALVNQTVADHSWGVVMLLHHFFPWSSKECILAAVHHDTPEYTTGDLPATAKWRSMGIKAAMGQLEKLVIVEERLPTFELSVHEEARIKVCDYLELMFYCRHEMVMGNGNMIEPFLNVIPPILNKYWTCFDVGEKPKSTRDVLVTMIGMIDEVLEFDCCRRRGDIVDKGQKLRRELEEAWGRWCLHDAGPEVGQDGDADGEIRVRHLRSGESEL